VSVVDQASPHILWFDECSMPELPRAGGKSVSLGDMIRAGIPVPPGFAVVTDAYRTALARSGVDGLIRARLGRADVSDVAVLTEISTELQAAIEAIEIRVEIEEAIRGSYAALGARSGQTDVAVAVRSSATAEDLPEASFAGQHDTFLSVRGADSVLRSVARCWASLFTARAISYRCENGFPHDGVAMAVAIQRMARARIAGIACTLNPANGDRSTIAIDASWGLGEAVARGEVTPDHYLVDQVALEIVKRTLSFKQVEYVADTGGGISRCQVPAERQRVACLTDEEVVRIAQMTARVGAHYGQPQYVEWAIDADLVAPEDIVVLQSRPETVWSRRPRSPISAGYLGGVEGVLATLLRPPRGG
jgi:pyruvate,water dikinase